MQKAYWKEHSGDATVEAMMLDSQAKDIDKLERPEVGAGLKASECCLAGGVCRGAGLGGCDIAPGGCCRGAPRLLRSDRIGPRGVADGLQPSPDGPKWPGLLQRLPGLVRDA